jgi:hypothetical protein
MDCDRDKTDEILGIVRCVNCGHRLDGEIECPFCSIVDQKFGGTTVLPKWIYMTACFLASPVSIYFILRSHRLSVAEKILASSGCLVWSGLYLIYAGIPFSILKMCVKGPG